MNKPFQPLQAQCEPTLWLGMQQHDSGVVKAGPTWHFSCNHSENIPCHVRCNCTVDVQYAIVGKACGITCNVLKDMVQDIKGTPAVRTQQ